ncbi:MAG: hypothetical protein ACPG45_04590 [Flavobacteriaceae bacterium]
MSKHNSMPLLHHYTKQTAFLLVKLVLIFAAFFFIHHKLVHNDVLDVDSLLHYVNHHQIITFQNLIILLLFSGLNWGLECLKWQLLVQEVFPVSFKKAAEQSLGSLTASIITPNRIGEYGAKAIYFKKSLRKKIVGLNLLGNLSQLSATLFFGIIGLLYTAITFKIPLSYLKLLGVAALCVSLFFLYQKFLSRTKFKLKGYSFKKMKRFTTNLNRETLYKTFYLSVLKYMCFSHQFYFLIWLFGVDVTYIDAMALIFTMYILVSIIPTVIVLDVLVKGSVAVWLFSFVNANELIIVTCITLMWLLNFALPSVIGSYFVLNFKFSENK